jgi:hypothetical protein
MAMFAPAYQYFSDSKNPAGSMELSFVYKPKGEWIFFESADFIIYCRSSADFKRIERKLRKRSFYFGKDRGSRLSSAQQKIAYNLDVLFTRAQEVLDMHPVMKKIRVFIFRDRDELQEEYFRMFRRREDIKSFYVYKFNAIFISEDDSSDSIMAHEMGHAIVNHYFKVMPPEKVSEMLAGYVDLHLDDE